MKPSSPFVIIDTGCLIALYTKRDRNHVDVLKVCNKLKSRTWVTTWPVMTETCHFFLQKNNIQPVILLFELCEKKLMHVFSLEEKHLSKMKSLMLKYRDLPMDLADASLVILAEEIGSGDIVSTDQRDFKTFRWKNRHPFRNLLAG